ncbi:MAG TPA: NAD(P)-binding domain-containing protein [Ideonella sp.]|uniref:NADPH-dependent F420 reductase n=1 Tax=Ideonella sp. TaxID=1929293 RepID=UPI002E311A5C|nr:NAD(P)-binding domain-containing protein [Ideonella sp.]HEX5686813.1 NAD(P)-binding domain-containing protein [Ideonella sp.]
MKIGILGSGDVAKTLAAGFLAHGHEVMLGTRDPAKVSEWAAKHPTARVGSFADSAAFGEIGVLAVKGSATEAVLKSADASRHLAGKVLVDATNPIADLPPDHGVLRFFTTLDDALMERLQRAHPAVKFVKAFNSVGAALMIDPTLPGGRPTMFICGDDAGAKAAVTTLLAEVGWDSADMGAAAAARAIEPLCMLWCIPGFLRNDWVHAFKLVSPA